MVEDSSDGDEGKQLKGLPPRLDDAPSHPAAEPAPAPHKRAKAEPEI
jgi:hypothetical protein